MRLVGRFSDPSVGGVSGALIVEESAGGAGSGIDQYWHLEKTIRGAESQYDSSVGCSGAVYAIRRELFIPLPDDTLLDDVIIPMFIALKGYRIRFEPRAVAYDPQRLEPEKERHRKRRTLAGNFQMLFRYPKWLLPWHNRLWWQLISHKYLRIFAPFFLLTLFFTNVFLANQLFYRITLYVQLAFYAIAVAGMLLKGSKLKILTIPAGFVFLNLMAVEGFIYYLTHRRSVGW